ncbi:MAG: protein kinase [Planctomycetes bacterium]|nr:protein kinase [Planctomycetota bacterium]
MHDPHPPTQSPGESGGSEELLRWIDEFLQLLDEGLQPDIDEFVKRAPAALAARLRESCQELASLKRALPLREQDIVTGKQLGDFRILRELGHGAMGVVYLALQESLQRLVALKVLPVHLTLLENRVERFRREALAAAKLRHPSIVPIFAVGEERGMHYFAMEYVRGKNLAQELETQRARKRDERVADSSDRLGSRANGYIGHACEIAARIARALDYAHGQGVIHRDVKPQNILIDENGEPFLVDFGLAKDFELESLSGTGDRAGTPHYMSPEQALARRAKIDHRTDVFSLGVVLYEMLALRRPFEGTTFDEILHEIGTKDPRPVRTLNRDVPRDLAVIVEKALEKDPARRYATAGAFAEDLERFLRHESIIARPPSLFEIGRRKLARHRLAVSVVTTAVAALSLGIWWRGRDVRAAFATVSITTDVPGARVTARPFVASDDELGPALELGRTPVTDAQLEPGFYRFVVATSDGFAELARYVDEPGKAYAFEARIRPTAGVVADMVRIDGGDFVCGEPTDTTSSLRGRTARVAPFWIDPYEVSNAEYREFVLATGHRVPPLWKPDYRPEFDRLPVAGVTREDAVAFAEWAGKRLPTDLELQRVGRGRDGRLFPWGDTPDRSGTRARVGAPGLDLGGDFAANFLAGVVPVDSLAEGATPEGVFHLIGNVAEWTDSLAYSVTLDGSTVPPTRIVKPHPTFHDILGAAWPDSPAATLTFRRTQCHVDTPVHVAGIRCAKSVEP